MIQYSGKKAMSTRWQSSEMAAASRTASWKGILSAMRSSMLLKALILQQLTTYNYNSISYSLMMSYNYYIITSLLHQFSTSFRGALNISIQSRSLSRALTAVFLVGRTTDPGCSCHISWSRSLISGSSETIKLSVWQTSRGYSQAIGRLVLPFLVRM